MFTLFVSYPARPHDIYVLARCYGRSLRVHMMLYAGNQVHVIDANPQKASGNDSRECRVKSKGLVSRERSNAHCMPTQENWCGYG